MNDPRFETSDAELARRCRGGDHRAWRVLVARLAPLVYRMARRLLRAPDAVEDACQETFLRVHSSFPSYDPARPLAPWVARIAYRVCLKRLAADGRAPVAQDVPPAETADPPPDVRTNADEDGFAAAARSEACAAVEQALGGLSAQDQMILTLRYREDLSDPEIAEVMEMPVGTIKTRLFRARNHVREALLPFAL